MRTCVSILLLIVCVVLGISTNSSNNAAVQAAEVANTANSRSGYGVGQFWWSNTPANAVCENGSYPAYDAAAHRLLLQRGEFTRVLESDLDVTSGISAAPECRSIAASVADRLVIWDVASGERRIELPNTASAVTPLVLWSPDGADALIAAGENAYLWRDGGAVVLADAPLKRAAYPSIYWDTVRAQVIVGAENGVLVFDTASGALREAYAVAGLVDYRVVGNLLLATGSAGIDVWDLGSGAHVRLPKMGE